MFSSKIYSHPDKLLINHLENVAEACLKKLQTTKHNLSFYFQNDVWEKLVWLMGFSHDFGKATSFFQKYLFEENEDEKIKLKNQPETNHSLISAVIAFFIAKEYVKNKDGELLQMTPFFIYLIIKKHHGNINNAIPLKDELSDSRNEVDIYYEHLDTQFEALDKKELRHLFDRINKELLININIDSLPESLNDFFKKELRRKEKKNLNKLDKKIEYYLIFQFLYSLLLYSDKEDAIFGKYSKRKNFNIDENIIEKFKTVNFGEPERNIDKIREAIFIEANETVSNIDLKQKIFSLNVPTGSGKTLTALSVALKLRKKMEAIGIKPRIIYGLPFTSIIDQNYDVYKEIFQNPDSDLLLKHHHLAEISYAKKDEDSEFEPSEAKFMIESWESEIIVTTFFQIFHTLFTNRNRMVQKFNKLAGSIVLLDEVQSVPYKYWLLIRKTILKISELFNVYFILITATQPRIFEPDEIVELVPNKSEYFARFNRVNLHFESESISLKDYIEKCKNAVEESNSSFLFVMNTIKSSMELFKDFKKIESNAEYFYLSTNIIPKHRLELIKQIKNSKKRKIIVSTQMIEAGVDIDIENVWRDFAPLESVNQVCGRCNRNFSETKGNVRIFEILNEEHNNTPFSKYIYGKSALSIIETKEAMGNKTEISETEFLKNMDSYYEKIKEKVRKDDSNNILKMLEELRFADLYKSFKLIEDDSYDKKDIFVEFDDAAKEVWEKFVNLKNIEDIFERKNIFLEFKKDFYDYVISVPTKFISGLNEDKNGIVYLRYDLLTDYYDKNTGWKRNEEGGACFA